MAVPVAIRPLTEKDVPEVAQLYWSYLRQRRGPAPTRLLNVFRELWFENPFVDPDFASLVFESLDGRVVGFSSGMVRKMCVCGQLIRVGIGGNLVFHPEFRRAHLASSLVEAFFDQKCDLALVDSANDPARHILIQRGFSTIPGLNLHWRRPLRPLQYALCGISRSFHSSIAQGVSALVKPVASAVDGLGKRKFSAAFQFAGAALQAAELTAETLLQCLDESHKLYSMWMEYDLHSLDWLLNFMQQRAARGPIRKVVLRDTQDRVVGWYIYYVDRASIGEVVQLAGAPGSTGEILRHLFHDASQRGLVGLHGLVNMRQLTEFSENSCFFTCRGGWTMARSPHPELLRLLDTQSFFTRLDGEWALDPGE